ncbi:MAG: glycosyltransferase family 1 protein, partial [Fulvivirga sp.]|nr:glycosyltransferase family 1 protein [Fulvivirga sp.]
MKERDFIIIGAPEWELKIGSNIRNIAYELSRQNRVIYVNPPFDRNTLLRERNNPEFQEKKAEVMNNNDGLTEIKENLWLYNIKSVAESLNWIPFHSIFLLLNKVNVKRFGKAVSEAVQTLNFKDFILINDSLMFKGYGLRKYLDPSAYLYYIRDNLITQPYFKKHGQFLEPRLINEVDAVIANSLYLRDYAKKYNENSFYVGQGYENENFDYNQTYKIPEDIIDIKKPIIGYIGALTSLRLDIPLMEEIAKRCDDFSMVLVGPEDEAFKQSNLHQLKNVHFLGLKKMNELAAYVRQFDVCINPQLVNDLTIG